MAKGRRGSQLAGKDRLVQISKDLLDAAESGDRQGFALKVDRRYEELKVAFGQDKHGHAVISQELLNYGAGIAYAALLVLVKDGDRGAMEIVWKSLKGEPVQPFEVRLTRMTPDDADKEAVEELMASGMTEREARARWKVILDQLAEPGEPVTVSGDEP